MRDRIMMMIEAERRRRVGKRIAAAYREEPQADDDDLARLALAAATQTLRALEAEEREARLEW